MNKLNKIWLLLLLPVVVGLMVNWLTPIDIIGALWKAIKLFVGLFVVKVTFPVWGVILLIIALGLLFDFLKMGGGLGGEEARTANLLAIILLVLRFAALGVCSMLSLVMFWRGARGRQRVAESDLDDSRTQ